MHCTRCGNPMSSHTNVCPVCHYTLTEDEYKEGIEEENKARAQKHKKLIKEKKEKPIRPQIVNRGKVTAENASEITIINDKSVTVTNTGQVSGSRFIGYILLLLSDVSFVLGTWYLWYMKNNIELIMGVAFVLVRVAFVALGANIIKSAGVNAEFIKKNSITTAILGLLVSLGAFILLLVEMGHNNPILIFVSIGLLIMGVASFGISMFARESDNHNKK